MLNIRRLSLGRVISFLIIVLWALLGLFPLYWLFVTAFSPSASFLAIPPHFWPAPVTVHNFQKLFAAAPIIRWFFNSFFLAICTTTGSLFLDSMAAYSFAKGQFRGRDRLFWLILLTMMIPLQATLVPLFLIMSDANLLNSYWAILLPAFGQVWGVFLLRQYMLTLSSDYFDAARLDGANEWQVYWHVVLPLSTPALGALGLLTFIGSWNDFLWPLIALNSRSLFTLQVGLSTLQQQYSTNFGFLLAGGVVSAVPTILIFLVGQRFFVKGLTTGGMKG